MKVWANSDEYFFFFLKSRQKSDWWDPIKEGRSYSYDDLVIHFTYDVLRYSYDYPSPFLA